MIADTFALLLDRVTALALSPGSQLSLWSLLAAGLIAAGAALAKRGGRAVRLRALVRAMFPRQRLAGASARADLGFTLMAIFVTAALIGWAIVSHVSISAWVETALGTPLALGVPAWLAVTMMTVTLWVAYEFAYWFDHYLSHRWAWLWAFHKVHHSAETLSPLTVFRVHPVDSIVFYNIVAVVTGVTAGLMHWVVGAGVSAWTIGGANIITVAALLTVKHLHHSHAWIAWNGRLGRILLSPAHHQIHHSVAVEHHDRNFGDMLGVFDWLAGTLHQPSLKREILTFGVDGLKNPHSVTGALVEPFADAANTLRPKAVPTLSPR
jgi:sterol desaturase/sphingolipid hydroxylase (fatty acid hydroxylase superfamily)